METRLTQMKERVCGLAKDAKYIETETKNLSLTTEEKQHIEKNILKIRIACASLEKIMQSRQEKEELQAEKYQEWLQNA